MWSLGCCSNRRRGASELGTVCPFDHLRLASPADSHRPKFQTKNKMTSDNKTDKPSLSSSLQPLELVTHRVKVLRGQRVIVDTQLAALYWVETNVLV